MEGISKQKTGFKFGKYRLTVVKVFGEVIVDGRIYRSVLVQTEDGQLYKSLRLYNRTGKFIKQLLYEPSISQSLSHLIALG